MRFRALLLAALGPVILSVPGLAAAPAADSLPEGLYATWETPRGAITAELYYEFVPLTVANFVGLAEGTLPATTRPAGRPFFDGLTFHRIVPGFVVQGGCPRGTGEGTPGYEFVDEFTPLLKHDAAGILSMANAGPNTNGSQFFFTLAPVTRLDYKHTVFGKVVQGVDVLPRLQQGDAMTSVTIRRIGERARSFRADAAAFATLQANTAAIPPRDPAQPPLFVNETNVPMRDGYDTWIAEKLHHYAAVTGTTIHVRLLPRFARTDGSENEATANPLRSLHAQLAGSDAHSATIVFLARENRWRLWLGDGLLARFGLTPEAAATEPGAKQLHALKQDILAEAKKFWSMPAEPRHRAVDSAVTDLILALDRPKSVSTR